MDLSVWLRVRSFVSLLCKDAAYKLIPPVRLYSGSMGGFLTFWIPFVFFSTATNAVQMYECPSYPLLPHLPSIHIVFERGGWDIGPLNIIAHCLQMCMCPSECSSHLDMRHSTISLPLSYLAVYGGITVTGLLLFTAKYLLFVFSRLRASQKIHDRLVKGVLSTTFRVLDQTPTGRIIARFTQDMGSIDNALAESIDGVLGVSFGRQTLHQCYNLTSF